MYGHPDVWLRDWQVQIFDMFKDLSERKVKETIYIKLAPLGCRMDRDEGKDFSPWLWLNAIKCE